MKVELLLHWDGFEPGHVFETIPEGIGKTLIARGAARELTTGDSDNTTDNGASDANGSQDASKHIVKRQRARR